MDNETVNTEAAPATSTHEVVVDHGERSADGSIPNNVKGSNHDRLEQAYAQVTGQKLKNEAPSIETLDNFNLPDGDHKGIDYNKMMNDLPDDAKKILANLRSDYTRKTQEISRQQKELEGQRQALLESEAYRNLQSKAAETPVDADPFDPAVFNQRIEQEVAKRLAEVLQPMQNEWQSQQRKAKLDKFKSDNPDLETYKTEIVEVLKGNEHITLEQAYFLVKGKNQTETLRRQQEELNAYKSAAKEYGLKVGIGSVNSGPLKPPATVKRDAYSIFKWLQANQKV